MITVACTCGQTYQLESAAVADQFCCPSCGKEAAEVLAAPVAAAPQFRIFCGIHPDQPATQNCLNCAKPLCMECVRANGYYCSADCKAAVAESVPDAVAPDQKELTAVGAQVEQQMERAGQFARKLGIPALIVVGLVAVGYIVAWLLAPKGQIIASLPVSSAVDSFHFISAGRDAVLVQANDELSLVSVPSLTKTWSVRLSQWEEKVNPPPGGWPVTDDGVTLARTDPLELNQVQDDVVIVNSGRQLVALDKRTGELKWQKFDANAFHADLTVHPGGVWRSSTNHALATGEPTGTFSHTAFGQTAFAGGRLALLSALPRKTKDIAEDEELTAGSIHDIDIKSIVSQAQGKKVKPRELTVEQRLQIIGVTDGRLLVEKVLTVPYSARLMPAGDAIAVVTSSELQLYRDQPEPLWQASLPATPEHVIVGGGMLLAVTEAGLFAFDAKTGAERWKRADLNAQSANLSPDGDVYVTVAMSKEQFKSTESEKFRLANIRIGVTGPASSYRALLRLDPQTGQTRWGVRNIGEELLFDGDKLFVIDRVHEMNLLADQIMVGSYSVRQIVPSSGKDKWAFLKAGDLYQSAAANGGVVVVMAVDSPSGRSRPRCPYELVLIAGK